MENLSYVPAQVNTNLNTKQKPTRSSYKESTATRHVIPYYSINMLTYVYSKVLNTYHANIYYSN